MAGLQDILDSGKDTAVPTTKSVGLKDVTSSTPIASKEVTSLPSTADLVSAGAQANATLGNTVREVSASNASIMQQRAVATDAAAKSIEQSRNNLNAIAMNPLANVFGLFDSDWNSKIQVNNILGAKENMANADLKAQTFLQLNNTKVEGAQAGVNTVNAAFQLKSNVLSLEMQNEQYLMMLDENQRKHTELALANMSDSRLAQSMKAANSGSGEFAAAPGLVQAEMQRRQSIQQGLEASSLALQSNKLALGSQIADSNTKNLGQYLANYSPNVLGAQIQQVEQANAEITKQNDELAKAGKPPKALLTSVNIGGAQVPFSVLQQAYVDSSKKQGEVRASVIANLKDSLQVDSRATALQTSGAALGAIVPDSGAIEIIQQTNQLMKQIDTSSHTGVAQADAILTEQQARLDKARDAAKAAFSLPEAKQGVDAFYSEGRFTSPSQSSAVLAENLRNVPAVAGINFYSDAIFSLAQEAATQNAQGRGWNNSANADGKMSDAELMASISLVKPQALNDIITNKLQDPQIRAKVAQNMTNSYTQYLSNQTLAVLNQPTKSADGTQMPANQLWADLGSMVANGDDKITSVRQDGSKAIDTTKLAYYLEQQRVLSGGKVDYLQSYINAAQAVAETSATVQARNVNMTFSDRALDYTLFRNEGPKVMGGSFTSQIIEGAKKARIAVAKNIQDDLTGLTSMQAQTSYIGIDPLSGITRGPEQQVQDNLVPSALGGGLTVEYVKKLYGTANPAVPVKGK